jgi:toxin-antitoxin system, toxin component, relE family
MFVLLNSQGTIGAMPLNVELYQMADGTEPVADFLQSLNKSMHAKAMQVIDLLEARGHLLRPPYSKNLGDGIMELRISIGNNISRILYFFVVRNTAILTNGFIKKTQKTPPTEIQRAKQYRNDYMRRCLK